MTDRFVPSRPLPLLATWLALPALAVLPLPQSLSAAEPTPPAPARPDPAPSAASLLGELGRTVVWGGYGELHYNNIQAKPQGSTNRDMLEMHRLVLTAEASLHKHARFVAEIEIEHGFIQGKGSSANAGDAQGELEIEQAFIEFSPLRGSRPHAVRIGTQLVPISVGNLHHEPTLFHGVERPEVDRLIVPTTWYDNGIAAVGDLGAGLAYQVGIWAGLDGSKFRAQDGLREGRQKGYKSTAEDLLYAARLDWKPAPGIWLGLGGLTGQGDQDTGPKSNYWLWAADARLARDGAELAASVAQGGITAGEGHPNYRATGPLPSRFYGWNATLSYDVLRPFGGGQVLAPFVRYEVTDTQERIPDGTSRLAGSAVRAVWVGLTWRPYHDVALKFDYQDRRGDNAVDVWNLGLGFVF